MPTDKEKLLAKRKKDLPILQQKWSDLKGKEQAAGIEVRRCISDIRVLTFQITGQMPEYDEDELP